MLRITKHTDYGIVLLTHLANAPGRMFSAQDLAGETQLPAPMVSKILKLLAREGVVASHRGVKGGYSLSRSSDEITVAEVISALEGPIAITECIDEGAHQCGYEPLCGVRSNWNHINQVIREALESITLTEMNAPAPRRLVSLGRGPSSGSLSEEIEETSRALAR
jgi:FeS assembly SUF system regulator